MSASKVLYTGDGVILQFNVPFPFLSQTHIQVFVNEVLQLDPMNYDLSGSTVTFGTAPEQDDAIVVRRNTSPTTLLVDFVDGSILNENDLDTAYLHNFYLLQETTDSFNELINNILLKIASGTGIVETETDLIIAALVNEMLGQAAAATLQTRINDIDDNAEAIISIGADIQVQINTLAQGVAAVVYIQDDEPVPGVGGIPDPILDGARWYDSNDNNASYIYDQGGTQWLSIADPRVGVAVTNITVLQADVITNAATGTTNAAAVVTEQTARADGDTAIATDLLLLGAANGGGTAFILDLSTTEIGGDESLSTRFSSITADHNTNVTGITDEATARAAADSTIATDLDTEEAARASADSALDADIITNAASITSEASTRANNDGAIATTMSLIGAENAQKNAFIFDIDTVKIATDVGDTFAVRFTALGVADANNAASIVTINSTTIPGVEATVTAVEGDMSTAQGDISGLQAKYGVTLNVNGYITGFLQNNDGETGTFVILADKFAIVDPSGDPGEDQFIPFSVDGGVVSIQNLIINGSLLVNGSVVGSHLANGTIGTTQIGANSITTTQLNANSVTAAKIQANAITAGKISVTNLAAIKADLGAITAGTITLDSSGHIKGGQTAFNAGTGFFLGYESGTHKFSIGDGGSDNYFSWDGTTLTVKGNVRIGSYVASNNAQLTANTQRSGNSDTLWLEVKDFKISKGGTVRLVFDVWLTSVVGGVVQAGEWRVKRNGSIVASGSHSSTSHTAKTNDITILDSTVHISIELKNGIRNTSEPVETNMNIDTCSVKWDELGDSVVITD